MAHLEVSEVSEALAVVALVPAAVPELAGVLTAACQVGYGVSNIRVIRVLIGHVIRLQTVQARRTRGQILAVWSKTDLQSVKQNIFWHLIKK